VKIEARRDYFGVWAGVTLQKARKTRPLCAKNPRKPLKTALYRIDDAKRRWLALAVQLIFAEDVAAPRGSERRAASSACVEDKTGEDDE
jgi:hypothetical protein